MWTRQVLASGVLYSETTEKGPRFHKGRGTQELEQHSHPPQGHSETELVPSLHVEGRKAQLCNET